ncbi:hypothetical protein ACH51_05770 [Ralstonia solanacearum]|nr:hypothetical protein ACH51_05770 [Ralstonia solanacearum]
MTDRSQADVFTSDKHLQKADLPEPRSRLRSAIGSVPDPEFPSLDGSSRASAKDNPVHAKAMTLLLALEANFTQCCGLIDSK